MWCMYFTTSYPVFVLNIGTYAIVHSHRHKQAHADISHHTKQNIQFKDVWNDVQGHCQDIDNAALYFYMTHTHNKKHTQHIYKVKQPGNSRLFWNHLLFCVLYVLCWNERTNTCCSGLFVDDTSYDNDRNVYDLELGMCGKKIIKHRFAQLKKIQCTSSMLLRREKRIGFRKKNRSFLAGTLADVQNKIKSY